MHVILFNYSGAISLLKELNKSISQDNIINTIIQGRGCMHADPVTGKFSFNAIFDEFPELFNPIGVGVSIFGIACAHSSKSNSGKPNFFDLSNGFYKSSRIITIQNSDPAKNSHQITIDSNFTKFYENIYNVSVNINGIYSETSYIDYNIPLNYTLPLTYQNGILDGNFDLNIPINGGGFTPINIYQTNNFLNGTTGIIQDYLINVNFDTNLSFWDKNKKTLYLTGSSTTI